MQAAVCATCHALGGFPHAGAFGSAGSAQRSHLLEGRSMNDAVHSVASVRVWGAGAVAGRATNPGGMVCKECVLSRPCRATRLSAASKPGRAQSIAHYWVRASAGARQQRERHSTGLRGQAPGKLVLSRRTRNEFNAMADVKSCTDLYSSKLLGRPSAQRNLLSACGHDENRRRKRPAPRH